MEPNQFYAPLDGQNALRLFEEGQRSDGTCRPEERIPSPLQLMSKYQIQRKPAPYVSSPPFLVLGGRRIQSHPENRKPLLVRHHNGYDKILLTTYLTHQMVWLVVAVLRPMSTPYKSGGACEVACPLSWTKFILVQCHDL